MQGWFNGELMKRLMLSAAIAAVLIAPVSADVTITATTSGKGMGQAINGESVRTSRDPGCALIRPWAARR